MKRLVSGLAFAVLACAQHPKVSECFKVQSMIRADEEHYWTTWTNTCPYTIDAVYVKVRFADRASKDVADGVWSLHFIPSGAHRTMRFSAPGTLADFASVRQQKITGDMSEAFGKPGLSSVELAAVSAYRGAVSKEAGLSRRATPVSAVVSDAGEGAYLAHAAPEKVADAAFTASILKTVLTTATPVGDPGEGAFRTDYPDPWQAVLSAQESAVSPAPRASFVRFVSEDKPLFQ